MNHQGRDIYLCGQPEEFPSASAIASAPTFDFLQLPHAPLVQFQFNPLHGVTGHAQVNFMDLQKWHLQCFWQQQMQAVENLADYKQHQLPLARIKRIMKMEGDAKMVSADTPIFFAKACELFISELAVRSWLHAEQCKRHTIRRTDVAGAICHSNVLNFLLEILHAEELQVYMRQPPFLRQQMMPQQQSYPNSNNFLYEPPPPLVSF
ncbi:hypothetical protein ZIOFF_035900 [Zingiber officinale]|uniref:Core Histone H2A/H2B/H3 domain-containing protein n=1 Tax=Zingiber officinale TaxID=94328 RepID=A0A8J5GHB1_ZINOF|nr:hypothetical protein ZIOFF_035900 [Zingiber officinale]